MVLSFEEHATARAIERQLFHRGAARSVSAMASILAHEVKNPLAGIRGAVQVFSSRMPADAMPGSDCTRLPRASKNCWTGRTQLDGPTLAMGCSNGPYESKPSTVGG